MMQEYVKTKEEYKDCILFYRLGDFYEMFFEDAKEASSILGLTLTKRHGIPMCGVPHHSAEGYIGRLVKGGKRVAIAEQTTIPQPGKLVERELTRVISAGTLADMNLLDSSRHNYIVALYKDKKHLGLACVDHTTGEFSVAQFEHMDLLLDELAHPLLGEQRPQRPVGSDGLDQPREKEDEAVGRHEKEDGEAIDSFRPAMAFGRRRLTHRDRDCRCRGCGVRGRGPRGAWR